MTPENYAHSISPKDAATCYEKQLLLQYDHYLLMGKAALAKAKSRFNTVLVSSGMKTGTDSPDQAGQYKD